MRATWREWSVVILFILFALFVVYLIDEAGAPKARTGQHVPCKTVYTNSRGQQICIINFPDSVYRR